MPSRRCRAQPPLAAAAAPPPWASHPPHQPGACASRVRCCRLSVQGAGASAHLLNTPRAPGVLYTCRLVARTHSSSSTVNRQVGRALHHTRAASASARPVLPSCARCAVCCHTQRTWALDAVGCGVLPPAGGRVCRRHGRWRGRGPGRGRRRELHRAVWRVCGAAGRPRAWAAAHLPDLL
jgi:hypothetical protein